MSDILYEILKVTDEVAEDVVHMDFSKAFNKIPHGRLAQEIKSHETHIKLVNYLEGSNRWVLF